MGGYTITTTGEAYATSRVGEVEVVVSRKDESGMPMLFGVYPDAETAIMRGIELIHERCEPSWYIMELVFYRGGPKGPIGRPTLPL